MASTPRRDVEAALEPGTSDGIGARSPSGAQRLAAATRQLSATIAATENLAQERAELLRMVDVVAGGNGNGNGNAMRVVSLREAAAATGRHPEVLRRWCSQGRLPAIRVGRTWAISSETLATLISQRDRARPRFVREDRSG